MIRNICFKNFETYIFSCQFRNIYLFKKCEHISERALARSLSITSTTGNYKEKISFHLCHTFDLANLCLVNYETYIFLKGEYINIYTEASFHVSILYMTQHKNKQSNLIETPCVVSIYLPCFCHGNYVNDRVATGYCNSSQHRFIQITINLIFP